VRRELVAAAARLFASRGYDETTVDDIAAAAEVSRSTFFRYFPSKEAAAFPDEEVRVEVVSEVLETAPADEPLPTTIRRAALSLIDYDLEAKVELHKWHELLHEEPALAAYALRVQNESINTFTRLIAKRMGVNPTRDLRPRLAVQMAYAAVNSVWSTWTSGSEAELRKLLNQAFDVLEAGLDQALA
jgi:AcrR family transcriptional regulator